MNPISNLLDAIIGIQPQIYITDVNGIITKVTDWRYIACVFLMMAFIIMLYHSLITVLRIIGGRIK